MRDEAEKREAHKLARTADGNAQCKRCGAVMYLFQRKGAELVATIPLSSPPLMQEERHGYAALVHGR